MSAPLVLDLRDERCPLTFVRVRLLLESMPLNASATLLLAVDDGDSIRESLLQEGQTINAQETRDGHVRLVFCKKVDEG